MSACSSSQRVRFQLRRATETQWNENNTTLLAGEPGLNTTTNQLKIGDGITSWENLPYINVAGIAGDVGTPTSIIPGVTLIPLAKIDKLINVTLPNAIVENQGIIFTIPLADTGTGGTIVAGTLYYAFANYTAGSGKQIRVKENPITNVAF